MKKFLGQLKNSIPPQTKIFFLGTALTVLIMTGLRLAFMIVNWETFFRFSAGTLLFSYLNGVRFDLHVIIVITGIFYLICHIPGRWKFDFPLFKLILWFPMGLILIAVTLCVANIHYYTEAGRHLSYEILTVIRDHDDLVESLKMASNYKESILLFFILSILLTWAWNAIIRRKWYVEDRVGPIGEWVYLLLCIIILAYGHKGTVNGKRLKMSNAFIQGVTELGHLTLNPLFTVGQSLGGKDKKVHLFYPEETAVDKIQELLDSSQLDWYSQEYPIYRKNMPIGDKGIEKYNIVILLLESWSPVYIGAYNGEVGVTPEFDKLASEGLLFENFYAVGNRTIEALAAICLGIPSFNHTRDPRKGSILSGSLEQNSYQGIGSILAQYGYTSLYFHGMDRSYFRHATIPTLAGFTRHMDKERLKLTPEEAGGSWGGWDHVMLDRLFEVMRTEQEPFFNLWISLSSHPPFRTPNDPAIYPGVEKNTFKDTLHYTDHFLGRFFRRAREQDYFNRTIFIITADHPIKRIKTMEGRHLIPFLIYAPDIIQPGRNTRVASQLDVIPTLIDILNLDVSHHAMGTSIFKKKANRYGFLNYAQGYGWISGREILEVAPDGKLIGVHNLDTGEPGISNISSSMETLLSFVQVGKTLLLENRYAPPLWQRKAEDHRDIASLPEKHMK